jgi:hypothetical protein
MVNPNLVARVNQQPPMHQLVVLSTGWAAFFHLTSNGVHHSPLPFAADHYTFIFWGLFFVVFSGPNLTHSYPAHFFTFINIVSTLVP